MKKRLTPALFRLTLALCALSSIGVSAQEKTQTSTVNPTASITVSTNGGAATAKIAITANSTPMDLARAAFNAEGGEKFRNLKSLLLSGSAELYPPNSSFSASGKFATVTAGNRVRREIQSNPPAPSIRIIDNGQQVYSSLPGMSLPPVGRFGMYLLTRFDQPGYTVTALPDKKKLRGFKITDSEGNGTEFYMDPNTNQVVRFSYVYNGITFGTERKKLTMVDGVLVAFNFSEALELPMGTAYIEYKVKEAKTNIEIGEDVFAFPQN